MIAKLTGLVDSIGLDSLIIDVNGVGYLVHASSRTLSQAKTGGRASLLVETVVREDAITLYGFLSLAERDMFRLLTSVQGVGAKVGLAILSVLEPAALQTAIAVQDKGALGQANGVGPKLAGRIVNELKDKVAVFVSSQPVGAGSASAAAPTSTSSEGAGTPNLMEDTVSALVNLGYKPVDAHTAAAKALSAMGDAASSATVSSLIPKALKELSTL